MNAGVCKELLKIYGYWLQNCTSSFKLILELIKINKWKTTRTAVYFLFLRSFWVILSCILQKNNDGSINGFAKSLKVYLCKLPQKPRNTNPLGHSSSGLRNPVWCVGHIDYFWSFKLGELCPQGSCYRRHPLV